MRDAPLFTQGGARGRNVLSSARTYGRLRQNSEHFLTLDNSELRSESISRISLLPLSAASIYVGLVF